MTLARRIRALAIALAGLAAAALAVPADVMAHALNPTYTSRLPLEIYLVGAATAVALSFAFVLVRDVRAERPVLTDEGHLPPRALRLLLRAVGLIAWLWIVAQGIIGGQSAADVSTLFLWVYAWVGLAMVSAFVGPVWEWVDPFATLHDLGAVALRRLNVQPWEVTDYPTGVGRWPAVFGFVVVVWLELVLEAGPQALFIVVIGYTVLSLALMAQFGRDAWRTNADVFTVWFRLLGRLAPYRLVDDAGRVARRSFASGLLEGGFSIPDVVIIALGVGSILFDGLSQTQFWFDLFGVPALTSETLLLVGFLGIVVAAALLVTLAVGIPATGAGLLPIAVGYLIAHYLTYLLIDGQRVVIAISDPFQQGWDVFGTAFYEPTGAWIPPGLVWTAQLAAVVGGHMLGAWGGHVVAALDAPEGLTASQLRIRQIPLAVVMVALTTLTLWSLGQAIVVQEEAVTSAPDAAVVVASARRA